jgi:hypothetical protein
MLRYILSLSILFCATLFNAQNTVGLLSYEPNETFDGYNIIFPHNQPNVYLLDNCGEIVHTWEDEANFRPGNTAYLMPNGNLVKAKRDAVVTDDAIWAGGGGETIEIRDWDNELIWSYTLNNETYRLHHDIAPMSNGHILAVAWELKTREEAIQAGRDSSTLAQDKLWSEYIFEIDPETDEIVWEWHMWDHLIQDFDATKDNFGVVADHPELVNINYDTHDGHPDWLHVNAMDFSFVRNQIIISVPYFDEVWIIDHTTTTEQASGSTGGFGNKGGDLMYRWGNPAAYNSGTADDKKLFFQHDVQFIDDFVLGSNPNYNSIAVFNNRVGEDFSTANIFRPNWDMYESIYLTGPDGLYLPNDHTITLTHPIPQKMYSTGLSSIQLLPNDNYLLTSGRFGYSFELTPDNEVVWEYKTPIVGGFPATQGDTLSVNNNLTFRMKRFPKDYTAFEGRDLSSKGWIELEPNETLCDKILDVEILEDEYNLTLYPNPTSNYLVVDWEAGMYTYLDIYNAQGQKVSSIMRTGGRVYLDVSEWETGLYFVQIDKVKAAKFIISR